MIRYAKRVLTAFSILLNVILGGRSNQTFSATQYQRKRNGKKNIVWLIDKIFFLNVDHCLDAWVKWKIIHTSIRHFDKLGENFFDLTMKQYYEMVDDGSDYKDKRPGPTTLNEVHKLLSRPVKHKT